MTEEVAVRMIGDSSNEELERVMRYILKTHEPPVSALLGFDKEWTPTGLAPEEQAFFVVYRKRKLRKQVSDMGKELNALLVSVSEPSIDPQGPRAKSLNSQIEEKRQRLKELKEEVNRTIIFT